MRLMLRRKRPSAEAAAAARDAGSAYRRARDHWVSCEQCRNAARVSASAWCEQGLRLMNQGIAASPHWDDCPRCQQAQESVRSRQCDLGRDLDDAYRVACQRLAATGQPGRSPAGG